jgi:hypothetical protein
MRHRPFGIAGDWHVPPLRVRAPATRARQHGQSALHGVNPQIPARAGWSRPDAPGLLLCMGLILEIFPSLRTASTRCTGPVLCLGLFLEFCAPRSRRSQDQPGRARARHCAPHRPFSPSVGSAAAAPGIVRSQRRHPFRGVVFQILRAPQPGRPRARHCAPARTFCGVRAEGVGTGIGVMAGCPHSPGVVFRIFLGPLPAREPPWWPGRCGH